MEKNFDRETMRITVDYNNMMQETLGSRGLSVDELKANRVKPSKVYTEDYFKDHALIFVTTVFSCTGEAPDVTCVHVSGNSIEVIARRSEAHDEGRQWWGTFLEVSLSDLPAGDSEVTLHSYHTINHDDEPEQT